MKTISELANGNRLVEIDKKEWELLYNAAKIGDGGWAAASLLGEATEHAEKALHQLRIATAQFEDLVTNAKLRAAKEPTP